MANRTIRTTPLLAPVLVEPNTAGSGSPNVLVSQESGTVFTNEGAAAANYHALPASAPTGTSFTFACVDVDGIRITADGSDTIRLAGSVTPAAGHVDSTEIGAVVTLVKVNATDWVATSIVATWVVTT